VNACGKMPSRRRRCWVVLLGEETDVVAHAAQTFEQFHRLVVAAV
jgi:hypothetical protein